MRMAKGINIVVFILALLSFANIETSPNDRNKAEKQPCFAPVVKEGQTGRLTFFISHDLFSSTDFFATIKRANNPVKDILVCTPGPPMNCEVDLPYLYGTANHSLTLLFPNITKEFADTYFLQMYANGSFQQSSVCPLVVEAYCDDGWYGPSCNRPCGSCLGDTPCNKESGHCTACKPGWTLPFCQKSCDDGWYGLSCTSRCGSCLGDQPCDKTTGHCKKCQPGLMSPFCQKAPRLPCRAHATTEGLTGTLTYFIDSNALSSNDFFATIRRTRHPDEYILVCTRRSPIHCNVNDQQYQSRGIRGNMIDLRIPNVTREFDDSYVFQVYANGAFQLPDTCHLVVKAQSLPACRAPAVTEGLTGNITYYIHPYSLSFEDFFATIRRKRNPDKDILVCTRRSPIHCNVNEQQYRSRGIRDDILDLRIPNVTREFDDSYVFQVYANGAFQLPDTCHLVVKDIALTVPTTPPDAAGRTDNDVLQITAVVGSLGTLLIVLVVIISVFCVRKNRRNKKKRKKHVSSAIKRDLDILRTQDEKPGVREKDALLSKQEQPSCKPDDFEYHSKRSVRGRRPQLVPPPKPEKTSLPSDKPEGSGKPLQEANADTPPSEDTKHKPSVRGRRPQLVPPPKPEKTSLPSDKSVESATALLAADLDYQPRDDMNTKPSENADEGETTTQNDRACADQQRLRKMDKTDSLKRSNRKLSDVSKTTRTSKSFLQPAELPEWVFQNMNRKQAKERLRSADNDDYSFMVIISEKKMFISVRLEQGREENYRIHHKDKGYWVEPQHCFADLSDLVDHYRKFEGFLGHTLGNRIGANISTT